MFLPECNARYRWYKRHCSFISPIPFSDTYQHHVDLCMKLEIVLHSEEHTKNTSASAGVIVVVVVVFFVIIFVIVVVIIVIIIVRRRQQRRRYVNRNNYFVFFVIIFVIVVVIIVIIIVRRRQQRRRYVNRNNYFVFDNNSINNKNKGLSMSSNAKAVTLLWITRKMSEGPTRPLVNLGARKPSQYYRLPTMTLQDIAMNAIFDNYGCGYDSLPPPLQRLYYDHIYKK